MDNLEERNKVLEMCSFPTLNQEERENRNRPVISNETESVILKKNELPTNKSPQPNDYTGEFY